MLNTVKVPKEYEPIFERAQELVSGYFKEMKQDPTHGTLEICGERYILIRAASMSVDFIETVLTLYKDKGEKEALNVARQLLFDIAHSLGRQDARAFHEKLQLKDPIEKLSAGPIHFSHSGWALVDISPESKPSQDENFYLIYDHPYSFEAGAWQKSAKDPDFPVCIMNAGYSSGWCEQSFGVTLVASEILCKAKGDDACRFIMGHPSRIEGYIANYLKKEQKLAQNATKYEIPGFFKLKQVDDDRRRAEERYRDLFYHAQTAIFQVEYVSQRIIEANDMFEKLLGYKKEELQIIPALNFWLDPMHQTKIMDRLDKEGSITNYEIVLKTKDGKIINCLASLRLVEKEGYIEGTLLDITERKGMDNQLKIYAAGFESSLNSMVLAEYKNGEVHILHANPAFTRLYGYCEEEVIGGNPGILKSGLTNPAIYKQMWLDLLNAEVGFWHGEIVNKRKDNSLVTVILSINTLFDQQKKPAHFIANHVDITYQKQAQEALHDSEERNRVILQASLDAFVGIDADGLITDWNLQAEKMFGWSREEVLGRSLEETFIPFEFKDEHKKGLQHFLATGEGPAIGKLLEFDVIRKDGEKFPIEFTITHVKRNEKHIFSAFIRDISGRKNAEKVLSEKIFDLERFQRVTIGREKRVIELKDEVKELKKRLDEKHT